MLIAYLWIRQTWHDAYLKWDKEEYDGLEVIRIPSSLVWRPDLVLYNKYARTSRTDKDFTLNLHLNGLRTHTRLTSSVASHYTGAHH